MSVLSLFNMQKTAAIYAIAFGAQYLNIKDTA
jgi:hypothetical protein